MELTWVGKQAAAAVLAMHYDELQRNIAMIAYYELGRELTQEEVDATFDEASSIVGWRP